jgi:hypothetical protein
MSTVTIEEAQRACDVAPVRGQTLPRGRAVLAGELRDLFTDLRAGHLAYGLMCDN